MTFLIHSQSRCECCKALAQWSCGIGLDQPIVKFCTHHYIEHLEKAHADSTIALDKAKTLKRAVDRRHRPQQEGGL